MCWPRRRCRIRNGYTTGRSSTSRVCLGERIAQGRRVLSLSQYGEGAGTRFAALFDDHPGLARLAARLGAHRLPQRRRGQAQGRVLPDPRDRDRRRPEPSFSAIFEERSENQKTFLQIDLDESTFRGEIDEKGATVWFRAAGPSTTRRASPGGRR